MKGTTQIKTDIYKALKDSELVSSVSGILTKRKRPINSTKEDIIIKVVSNDDLGNASQEAVAYINVYVPDMNEDGQPQADDKRLDTLEKLCNTCLGVYNGGDYRWDLKSQTIEDTGADCHVICNKIRYYQNNN